MQAGWLRFHLDSMEIPLNSAWRKRLVIGAAAALCLTYVFLAGRLFVAAVFGAIPTGEIPIGEIPKLASLQRAARLDPGNAEYRDDLGDYYAQAGDPAAAIEPYRAAVQLNPHSAHYWFHLASAYQVLADISNQTWALEHAIEADPTTPGVAWEAANNFHVRGDNEKDSASRLSYHEKALREYRVVLENDPSLAGLAIQHCWLINPDVDMLLRDVVPPTAPAYIAFLELLTTPKRVPLSTITAPSHPGGSKWVYTLEDPETGAESNGWVDASVVISDYTDRARGNNVTATITASTSTTIEIANAGGTATNTSADSDSPILTISGTKPERAATAKVWTALMATSQKFELRYVYEYLRYLLDHKDVDQARLVWQQAAPRFGLSSYVPTRNNLIVNGNFNLDILNGGFDWQYQKQRPVTLTLDPSEHHGGGNRSLLITLDGSGVIDAGISQFIAVQPRTTYEFSAYYKNGDFEGAGGPHFSIQDVVTRDVLWESDELKEAGESWKSVGGDAAGEFTTGDDCKLLVLRVRRLPEGSPIRGKLWVGDFRLVAKGQQTSSN
jgi:tetratricopeptide (TPR) repeat protein